MTFFLATVHLVGWLLIKIIIIFILAIPSGIGLGLGFHLIKTFLRKINNNQVQKKNQDTKDKLSQAEEELIAGIKNKFVEEEG